MRVVLGPEMDKWCVCDTDGRPTLQIGSVALRMGPLPLHSCNVNNTQEPGPVRTSVEQRRWGSGKLFFPAGVKRGGRRTLMDLHG